MFRTLIILAVTIYLLGTTVTPATAQPKPYAWAEPSMVTMGKLVKIKGSYFPPNANLVISLDGKTTSAASSSAGNFEAWIRSPLSSGRKTAEIQFNGSKTEASFYVPSPRLSAYPREGRIGSMVRINGESLPVFTDFSIDFAGRLLRVSTDEDGWFAITAAVPISAIPGQKEIRVIGMAEAVSLFEVLPPSLRLSPRQIRPGEKLIIYIEGAAPFSVGQIFIDGQELTPSPVPMAEPNGTLKVELVIPSLSAGDHYITAFRGAIATKAQTFTVLPELPGKIENAIAPIKEKIIRIWGYDNASGKWLLYDPAIPKELNVLQRFERGKGYFVLAAEDCEFASSGTQLYKLSKGWTLIGWNEQ